MKNEGQLWINSQTSFAVLLEISTSNHSLFQLHTVCKIYIMSENALFVSPLINDECPNTLVVMQ